MSAKGLWEKEISAGKFKVVTGLIILTMFALIVVFSYEYTVKLLESGMVPEFAKDQVDQIRKIKIDYNYYFWSQWFGKNLLQIGAGLALIFGASAISAETSRSTMNFLLARPITRQQVFRIKYCVNLACVGVVVVLSTLIYYLANLAKGHTYPIAVLFGQTVVAFAGLSVIFSIAVYCSTRFDQTLKAFLTASIATFVISIPVFFEPIAKFSLYYQMQGAAILKGSGFPFLPLLVMIVVSYFLYNQGKKRLAARDF